MAIFNFFHKFCQNEITMVSLIEKCLELRRNLKWPPLIENSKNKLNDWDILKWKWEFLQNSKKIMVSLSQIRIPKK